MRQDCFLPFIVSDRKDPGLPCGLCLPSFFYAMPLTMSLLPHSTHRDFAVLSAEHDGTAKTQFRKSNHEQTLCPIQTGSVRSPCDTSLTQFEDILPIRREGCLYRQRTLTHPFLLYQLRGQGFTAIYSFPVFNLRPYPAQAASSVFQKAVPL